MTSPPIAYEGGYLGEACQELNEALRGEYTGAVADPRTGDEDVDPEKILAAIAASPLGMHSGRRRSGEEIGLAATALELARGPAGGLEQDLGVAGPGRAPASQRLAVELGQLLEADPAGLDRPPQMPAVGGDRLLDAGDAVAG